jgi:methanethiol S-methyltransferase
LATFVINHFDLFGLRQVWRHLLGKPQAGLAFGTPFLYRIIRHPLYVGWLCVFWITPVMTVTHLLFAAVTTTYILAAIQFEEPDLMAIHPEYAEYRKQVPMILPRFPRQVAILPSETPAGESGTARLEPWVGKGSRAGFVRKYAASTIPEENGGGDGTKWKDQLLP